VYKFNVFLALLQTLVLVLADKYIASDAFWFVFLGWDWSKLLQRKVIITTTLC